MSLLRALIGRFSARPKELRRRRLRANRERFAFECLESRRVLATVSDDGLALNIALAANEALTIKSNDTAYVFTSNQSFSNASVAAPGDFSSFGASSLTLNSSGLARYISINISDAAAGARVTFADSGQSQYYDSINVMLDSGSTAPLIWQGRTQLVAGQSLSVGTQGSLVLEAAATVQATTITLSANEGITLGGGIYSPDGQVTLNADADGNGSGTLTLQDQPPNEFVQTGKLVDQEPGEQFFYGGGRAISGDGKTLAITAAKTNLNGQLKYGALFVYTKAGSTWSLQQKITADLPYTDSYGAVALSFDGNTLVVCNPDATIDTKGGAGAAIVYTRSGSTWTEQATLVAPVVAISSSFGTSVSLSPDGNLALISAIGYQVGSNANQGAAFVFVRSGNTWTNTQTITKSGGVAGEYFGTRVVISRDGSTAAISANAIGTGSGVGSVVVYSISSQTLQPLQVLISNDRQINDGFGRGLDLSADGSVLVASSFNYRLSGVFSPRGAVYIFLRNGNTWVQHQKLLQPDSLPQDRFSNSVSISANGELIMTNSFDNNINPPDLYDSHVFVRRGPTWDYYQNNDIGGSVLLNAEGDEAFLGDSGQTETFAYQGAVTIIQSPRNATTEAAGWIKSQGDLTVLAADFDLRGNIQSWAKLFINRSQSGRTLDIGSNSSGNAGLTASEFNRLIAPSLIIGRTSLPTNLAGPISISAPVIVNYGAASDLELAAAGSFGIAFTSTGSIDARDVHVLLRTEGTGNVLSGNAPNEINTGTANLTFNLAAGGIGQSSNPLTFTAANINLAASGSADHYLSTDGTVNIGASGLDAGSGNIQLIKGTWKQVAYEQIANGTGIVLDGATWDVLSFQETVSRFVGASGTFLSSTSGLLTVNSQIQTNAAVINGRLQSTGGLRKFGSGTTFVLRSQLYSGTTVVEDGTLRFQFSNMIPNSQIVEVQAAGKLYFDASWSMPIGQILRGAGTVEFGGVATSFNSVIEPGPFAATLSTRAIQLAQGFLAIDILGTAANQYDQLNVTGSVNLTSGRLALSIPTNTSFPGGSEFKIINNDAADAVIGTFDGLAEGSQLVIGTGAAARFFTISYRGGDGNDVVLKAMPTLSLTLNPLAISEKNGVALATVSRAGASTANAMTVSLFSSDTSEATVPATVVIPAGATTATFNVTAVDDNLLDGTQSVTISVGDPAEQLLSGFASVQVLDDETLSVTIAPASISEKSGTATGTVTRSNTDIGSSLLVTLSSSDTSEATVPETVLIAADQTSATFPITAVDDSLLDGDITLTITGTANGYVSTPASLTVTDYETLSLTMSATSMPELNGTVTGTVTRSNTDIGQAITVTLTSSDISEATVPAVITIAAGQASTTFSITSVDDNLLDGLQTTNITAAAAGYIGDVQALDVLDVELLDLLILPSEISENGGRASAFVTRGNSDIAQALVVQISVDDPSEVTVPVSVTIPAGQSAVEFFIDATDDDVVDGTQQVNVTVRHSDYTPATRLVTVTDWEPLTLDIANNALIENGGTTTATISRLATDTSQALIVFLSSSDTSEASVPATVTIAAGQTSANFTITAVDDDLLDGLQSVSISAIAGGFVTSSRSISVLDYEFLSLSVDKASISEAGGSATGTITRGNTDIGQPLVVTLVSSDTTEATVPAVVIIAANESSATFTITAVDDDLLDGNQTVAITPSGNGYFSQQAALDVTDFEPLSLSIVSSSVSERGATTSGTITRTDGTGPLTITLTSSDTTEATVPATISMVAGQLSAGFVITAIDDTLLDGPQAVTISASASTYVPASQVITITDYEELLVTLQSTLISEFGGSTTGTVRRTNTDISSPLTVTLASSDLSEASVPASVVIPAGQVSIDFPVQAADDAILDGRQTLSIIASSAGYVSGSAELRVDDHETITLTLNQSSISENGGIATGTITRSNSDISQALTVNLTSSDTSEATTPSTVVIPAGQPSAVFNITAQDDALLDGSQSVNIQVTATGYVSDTRSLTITDFETLVVTIDRTIINEQGGLATGTVRRGNSDISQPLTVTLVNGDASEVAIPTTVTIPANQASANFAITALDDGIDDGAQSVSIAISANGYIATPTTIIVADGVALALSFDISSISEFGGTTTGTVTRANTDTSTDLVVTLSSSDTSEATVPGSVTIRAGQQTATFTVTAVDDAILDGTQSITITAQAPSISPSRSTLSVTDYETLTLSIDRTSMSEAGGQATGTVFRSNADTSQELIVNLLSSDTSEATAPNTVTILANQSSAVFAISAVDDTLLDDTQRITVSTSAQGYVSASRDMDVTDAESLTLTIQAATISENGGVTTGLITRSNTDNTAALMVTLLSSDTSEASVPISITIAGGQSSANFTIDAVDDALLDGDQPVTITATSPGYADARGQVIVTDFETLQLSFNGGAISENGGTLSGTISRSNTNINLPLTVNLLSSDVSEVTVPASVTILAGQSSANFSLSAIDDLLLDGSQMVSLSATASGYVAATATVVVTDHEELTISLQDSVISEADGVTTATLTRGNSDIDAALQITLTSSDSSEVTVPTTVTIPAGRSSVTFTIAAKDDTLLDGTQLVSIGASATGYVAASTSLNVTDAESLTLVLSQNTMSEEGGMVSAVLTRSNTDVQSDLVVHLLSSDNTEAQVPATVVIPRGQQSIEFTIAAVDDTLLDGIQTVNISFTSAGYSSNAQTLSITDAERLTLTISPLTISERGGVATGNVTRSNTDNSQPLTVNLSNSDATEASIPVSVTIPAGQSSAPFTITAIDDSLLDGVQALTVLASTVGYSDGQHDLTVTDYETLSLTLSLSQAREDAGSVTVTVTRNNSDVDQPLTVTLHSSDASELTLPATIVIPAGQGSVSFVAAIVDDTLLDGTQSVEVTVSADGYESSSQTFKVLDAESLTLTWSITSLSEEGGIANVFVARSNTDNTLPLTVTLSNSDTTELSVPLTVTIPANQAGAAVQVSAVDDSLLDGTQSVTVVASAAGYADAAQVLTILDSEAITLRLSQTSMREADSVISGIVTRSNIDTTSPLVVSLASSDASEATVPSTVTIPAGQASIGFNISAVDDALLDGTQRIDVTATATGYSSALVNLDVMDVESLALSIDVSIITEKGQPATATITRSNSDNTESLVVSLLTTDSTQLVMPQSITIPAGQQSVSFAIEAAADRLLDGTQIVLVEARAAGYETDVVTLSIADNESLSISFDLASIPERNGQAVGRVSRNNTDNQLPLTVQLVSSSSAQASVPASVVILAGQAFATFIITSVNDTFVDGTQSVQIVASAVGYTSAQGSLDVLDDDRLHPWNNPRNPLDVNDSGLVTALDALLVINALNTRFVLPPTLPDPFDPVQYLDVDANGFVTPLDALLVINELNRPRGNGEGEVTSVAMRADAPDLTEMELNSKRRR